LKDEESKGQSVKKGYLKVKEGEKDKHGAQGLA